MFDATGPIVLLLNQVLRQTGAFAEPTVPKLPAPRPWKPLPPAPQAAHVTTATVAATLGLSEADVQQWIKDNT